MHFYNRLRQKCFKSFRKKRYVTYVDEHVSGVDGIIFVRIIGVVEAGEENRGDMRATNVSSDVDLLMSSAILIYQV